MCTSLLLALMMSLIFAIQSAPMDRQPRQLNTMEQSLKNETLLTCLYCAADCIKTSIQKLAEVRRLTLLVVAI